MITQYETSSTFSSDLAFSQKGENDLAKLLQNRGYTVTTTQDLGLFSGYDIKAIKEEGKELRVEFKHDRMSSATGNCAIELYKIKDGVKEDSGLSATSSNVMCYKLGEESNLFFISTSSLKKYVENNWNKYRRCQGGDGGRSYLMLIPVEDFKNISRVLD